MTDRPFPIIAVGASAGGVEALSALFSALPAQLGAAFVVITHLAPHRESLLPEILSRHTSLSVETARNGTVIQRNHVYMNSPDAILKLLDGTLVLEPRVGEHNPIDIFLVSAAAGMGERMAVAILSGTGSDGAIGVKAVREAGGFTLAQGSDDRQPSHHGMPDAAVATGFVDCVLPIRDLAVRIVDFVNAHPGTGTVRRANGEEQSRLAEAKKALYAVLQYRVGHDFSRYKDKTFLRRVERRMLVHRLSELSAYVELIKADPAEATQLFRDLLIGVTNFFRDEASFDGLSGQVIPRLFEGKGRSDSLRIWVPGCATGEEVYSIAILCREAMADAGPQPRVQIFATDVDENALSLARAGRYPAGHLDGLSSPRRARHFTRDGNNYVVAKELRDLCLFSTHSVIRDPPFSQIDLISCRNLLIYFNAELQEQVIPLFHYALRPGGYLFLGASENVSQHADLFAPVDKKHRIFRRRDAAVRPAVFPLFARALGRAQPFQGTTATATSAGQEAVQFANDHLLNHHAPAFVLINEDCDVLHYSARTGKYLEAPAGPPSRNLLAIARKGLRMPLRSALQEAMEAGHSVRRGGIDIDVGGNTLVVDVIVDAMPEKGGHRQWMVIFVDAAPIRKRDDVSGDGGGTADGEGAVLQLERELQQTRERLQGSIEEYETSVEELKSANEELLSVNEELQSSNEELETAKEELQSLNEELHTVNAELAAKVEQLDRAHSDLRNLFNATQIATIFLDRKLTILNFTPAMAEVFKLIDGDRGRPLTDIVSLVDGQEVLDDFALALTSGQPIEKNVSRQDGSAHYIMRIVPFHAADGQVDGGIMTFVNVTAMVRAEGYQRLLIAELNHRVKNTLAVVTSMAALMAPRCRTVEEFSETFIDRVQGMAKTHDLLVSNEWCEVSLADLLATELGPFAADGDRVSFGGANVQLKPRALTTLGMVIHELAATAVKRGILGPGGGTLRVRWDYENLGGSMFLVLTWRESAGPAGPSAEQATSGADLIERILSHELDGKATTDSDADGLVVTMTIPAVRQHMTGQVPV